MDKKEFKLILKSYKGGKKDNSYDIGVYLHNNKKYKKAIKYFEEYLTLPNNYRRFEVKKYLADYYYNGLGVKQDMPKAIKMYDEISFIYKEVKPIIIRYYYNTSNYSKLIYMVKDYADHNEEALRFCYNYYKEQNYTTSVITYAEKLADKYKDKEALDYLVNYYAKYYAYCNNKAQVRNTLQKYSKHPQASFKLGQIYYYGIDVEQNYQEAYNYFTYANKKGYAEAKPYVGIFKYEGIIEEQNIKSALQLFASSPTNLARFYLFKHKVESKENISFYEYQAFEKLLNDCGEASAYLVKLLREQRYKGSLAFTPEKYINIAVNYNIPEGYFERGIAYFESKKYEEAYKDLMYAYERNQKGASIYLAKLLKEGLGCEKNVKKAEELLNESSDANSIYLKAMDLLKEKQVDEAMELLISIMDNHPEAKYEVATRYLFNSKDKNEQASGYKLLSQLDTRILKYNVAFTKCVYNGIGTKADYDKAAKLLDSYSRNSRYDKDKLNKEMDYMVGHAYYYGNGLKQDIYKARTFLEYSSKSRYTPATKLLEQVNKEILDKETKIKEEQERLAEIKKQEELKKAALERAKEVYIKELFDKYKNIRISIPEIKSVYRGYGALAFVHEVDICNRTSTIVVKGTMNYYSYISENDKKVIATEIYNYIKPYVDDFYKKYPDYPCDIQIKHDFTIWYNC